MTQQKYLQTPQHTKVKVSKMKSITKLFLYTSLSAACVYSHTCIGADNLVTRLVTEDRTTTLKANVNTPMREIKALAKQQLIEETVNILPTYIDSTQTLSGNNYEEKIKFVAAAMVQVKNEDYDIKIENDLVTMTIRATVSFDTNEIKRKVDKLESDEARSDLINSSISASTNLKSQALELETLYGLTAYQIQSESSLQQVLDSYSHQLINFPLNDLVKEFELKKKMEEVDEQLATANATNQEWLSLTEQERAEYEINLKIGTLINDSYIEQLKRPLTLKVIDIQGESVTLQVSPLEGVPHFVPWYASNAQELRSLSSSYPFGTFTAETFYNYGCRGIQRSESIESWHSFLRQSKNASFDLFSQHQEKPSDLKLATLKQTIYVPGYNVPILLPSSQFGSDPIVSQPVGVTWNLTKEEVKNKISLPTGGEILPTNIDYNDVPVWGIKLEIDGQRKVLPLVTRMESEFKTFNQKYRNRMMSHRVGFKGDASKSSQIEKISYKGARLFEYIKPYRTTNAMCGIPTRLEYPKFKVTKQLASKIQNASIEVFRY